MTAFKEINFTWPEGFKSDGIHANLRKNPTKPDLGWIVSKVPASAAGVYTRNQFQAAPIQVTKSLVKVNQQLQAIVVNSANANSFTGQRGINDVYVEQRLVAEKLGIAPELVGVASTGIIGEPLPMEKIIAGIAQLQLTDEAAISEAILTTDTVTKKVSIQWEFAGKPITISAIAKGSGMIHPNMGTMLSFVTTDAAISADLLQALLSDEVDVTFNQITIDGDTSTNDMVLILANGASKAEEITVEHGYADFKMAMHYVLETMAIAIAKDGEGATKLVQANVTTAWSAEEARQVAKTIVGSNLVKAAIFGQDPNWGRIIDAIGNTTAKVDAGTLNIAINGIAVVRNGIGQALELPDIQLAMAPEKVVLDIDLGVGNATGTAWGADLTYQYVYINAAYHS